MFIHQLPHYLRLMRLDKPIGILLLLWPTLWALWLSSNGLPNKKILFVFILGVVLTRSGGCIINDFADRHYDGRVKRTRERPLASGKISSCAALLLAAVLLFAAFLLVLLCNALTLKLAFIAAGLMVIYPFLKRVTHLPQLGLSIAFSWSIPMVFAAETESIHMKAWFLFFTAVLWPIIYDTMYALSDKEDDVKIGVKSTAILFANNDKFIIGLLQSTFVLMLFIVGLIFHLHLFYYICLSLVILLFFYQQWLIKHRDPAKCFAAFINNNWVGFIIFLGILGSFLLT